MFANEHPRIRQTGTIIRFDGFGRLLAYVTRVGILFGLKRSDFVQNANANGSFARGYDGMDGVPCGDQSSNLRVKVEMDFYHSTAAVSQAPFFFSSGLAAEKYRPDNCAGAQTHDGDAKHHGGVESLGHDLLSGWCHLSGTTHIRLIFFFSSIYSYRWRWHRYGLCLRPRRVG